MEGPHYLSCRLGPETTLVVRMALDPFPTRAGQPFTGLGAGHPLDSAFPPGAVQAMENLNPAGGRAAPEVRRC